jgi:predicted dehydrogenase
MNRRTFLQSGALSAGAAAISGINGSELARAAGEGKRVGLIGTGWYGKCDLFRLLQVAPVEVVALCDVDKKMLAEAAEMVATRQVSKKKPRTFHDYREMLKQKDLDIVLVATPDHWHALPMIAAVEAGADVYVQKPISYDVKLGNIALAEVYCYYHMRNDTNPPDTAPPEYLDWEMWTGPAPMRPYNPIAHPRGWRSFTEYGNGIMGDMCIHMLDMVRWMLGLGWPKQISSTGGILVAKNTKANIADTQTATFDFGNLDVVWQHRTWGEAADPKYPWGATIYGDKGTLKLSVMGYDFIPLGGGTPVHKDVKYELDEFPIDKTEKDLEKHVAPSIRVHMKDFLAAIASRKKPVADIEEGHISTASCILANMSMNLGRSLTWDERASLVVGDDEANKLLTRQYRTPWVHPGLAKG